MIELSDVRKAPGLQLKLWLFTTAERLKKQLAVDQVAQYDKVWVAAKENIGRKSCVFLPDKWSRYYNRRDMIGTCYVAALIGSLENDEGKLRAATRKLQMWAKTEIHEAHMEQDFRHCGLDMARAAPVYSRQVQRTVLMFWNEEGRDQTPLLIASDEMDELDGLFFEPDHLRSGHHGLACPVVHNILKGYL